MFAEIALNIPSQKTFHYAVPEGLAGAIAVGKRVLVPLRKRTVTGYILSVLETSEMAQTKSILQVLDSEPLFNEEDLRFYRWAWEYYFYPPGRALAEILPGGIDIESYTWITQVPEPVAGPVKGLTQAQKEILGILSGYPEGLSLKSLKKETGRQNLYSDIRSLRDAKRILLEDRLTRPGVKPKMERIVVLADRKAATDTKLTNRQAEILDFILQHGGLVTASLFRESGYSPGIVRTLEKKGFISNGKKEALRHPEKISGIGGNGTVIALNEAQEKAAEGIIRGISSGRYSPYLLHGVTGSGKTEVYLQAISEALKKNGSVIFLVPEIALTPQLLTRLYARFDEKEIAVLHSGIAESVRYDQWRRIQRGLARIVVGARSAVFAPTRNLKLIIVDEEHDPSYKQDDRMCYSARDLAVVRAKKSPAVVVLGSATPGIQSFFNTREKQFRYLKLDKRVAGRPLPQVRIVNMKDERDENGKIRLVSRALKEALFENLEAGKQSILFLNRRGFNTYNYCIDCASVLRCLNCSVSLIHHLNDRTLKCHYCEFTIQAPPVCPVCKGGRIVSFGLGTEKLEEEISRLHPQARISRMDSDTTSERGACEKILRSLGSGQTDILIGTQMISKGHDFPNVTLVGVVSADTALSIPDFRASEKTFQLLTQVSGRGGRGDTPGIVIIQTLNPDHYVIGRAREHDYTGFYEEEIAFRKELAYPPYSRMINLLVSGIEKDRVNRGAREISEIARELARDKRTEGNVRIIGPLEAPIAKIKNRHRRQILFAGSDVKSLHGLTRHVLARISEEGYRVKVDVDPMNFM
jgi:primosomal protein N' (replication factor Y) (superfamily II helicase)